MNLKNEIYQQLILDHNKKPRNFKQVDKSLIHFCDGNNPLCGDSYSISLLMDNDDIVTDISFFGSGCAISKASFSMMTMHILKKNKKEIELIFNQFHKMVLGELEPENTDHNLGKLVIFKGVRELPARAKCASLSWHTLLCAIKKEKEVSTE